MKKKLFALLAFAAACATGHAQTAQFYLHSAANRSEIAKVIRPLPQGDVAIAGDIYDVDSGAVTNADQFVARVDANGYVKWQKQFGTAGRNDLTQNMCVCRNGDVIVVGTMARNDVYDGNTASIIRISGATGSVVWSKRLQDTTAPGGDVFFNVAELGNGKIVAIGGHDFRPGISGSYLQVFSASGTLLYNDVNHIYSDSYNGIVAVGDSSCYVSGVYDNVSYKDLRVIKFTMSDTAAALDWERFYDITGHTNAYGTPLTSNFTGNLYLRDSALIVEGVDLETYSIGNGGGGYVMSLDLDGLNPKFIGTNNPGNSFCNNNRSFPLDGNTLITAQNPENTFRDVFLWTSSNTSDAVVSRITGYQDSTAAATYSKRFNLPGDQSIFDIHYKDSILYLCGATNLSSTNVNNDIYLLFGTEALNPQNPAVQCSMPSDSIGIQVVPVTARGVSTYHTTFVSTDLHGIVVSNPNFVREKVCGDSIIASRSTAIQKSGAASIARGFSLVPNPTVGIARIDISGFHSGSQYEYRLMNVSGQVLSASTVGSSGATLDGSALLPGLYYVLLYEDGTLVGAQKLLIAR